MRIVLVCLLLGSGPLAAACGSAVVDDDPDDGAADRPTDGVADDAAVEADGDAPPEDGREDAPIDGDGGDEDGARDDGADACVPTGPEACNGADNDCDGETDNGLPRGEVCDGTDPDLCEEGRFYCVGGDWLCSDGPDDSPEICDGADNDCDGDTDEGFDLMSDPDNCAACGVVCGGARPACCSGECHDLAADHYHCGACGATCTVGGWRFRCCDSICHDLANCENHCLNPETRPCLRELCGCDG